MVRHEQPNIVFDTRRLIVTTKLSFNARSYNKGIRIQLCDVEIWLSRRYASILLTIFQMVEQKSGLPQGTVNFPRVCIDDCQDYLKMFLTFNRSDGCLDVIAKIPRGQVPEVNRKLRDALSAL